ncbi:MAG: hypothetical protein R2848_03610 [Thermomicrobiales bacterium]
MLEAIDPPARPDNAALLPLQLEALDAARQFDDAAARRWLWLAERIARARFQNERSL